MFTSAKFFSYLFICKYIFPWMLLLWWFLHFA